MARTAVTVTTASRSGVLMPTATVGDTVNGHSVANDGRTAVLVKNTGTTAAHNVTINFFKTVDGQAVTPRVESVDFGTEQLFGPFPQDEYGSSLSIDVDNAELTLRAVRVS